MVNSCSAVNCTNRVGAKSRGDKITFHHFPARPELRRLWTAALKRYDPITKTQWQPGKHACLCSEHFVPEDFRYNRGYRLLRDGAIPTRFNYLTTKLNKIRVQRNKKDVDTEVAPEPTVSSVLSSNLDDTAQNKSEEVSKTTKRSEEVSKTTKRSEEVSEMTKRSEEVSKTTKRSEEVSKMTKRSKEVSEMTNYPSTALYSQWLLENLFSLRAQDNLCDTVLIVGEKQLKAHSVVLSAGSSFFHSALKLYSKPGLRYLTLPGLEFDVLEIAVRFIYTGKFEVGKKYAKSYQRAELLNSLRKLGLNLQHLEECEIIHHSDEEEVVRSSVKMKSTDGAEIQDRGESSSDEEQSSSAVTCERETKLVVPVKSKNRRNQSSLVSSSLHVEEAEGVKVEDVGCDVALAPAEGCSSDARTPVDCSSVLSEMNNGWVLRSKTGVHFVEVPQELLAEIELESRKNLLDQTCGKAPLDSSKKSFHSRAKKVRTNERGPRCFIARPRPSCPESSVVPVHEDLPILKEECVPQKKQNYVCPTCGKEFLGIFRYNVHLRVHTGEKPYSCKSCGKTFAIMTNLTRHMRSHTGDRRYLCDLCGHAFIQKSTLEDHVASIHTKEKKHMCTFCGKFFPTLGCYRAHSKRHECGGSVEYRGEYSKLSEPMRQMCQEAVATASTDGASRFVCKICKKDYASKGILAIHLKRHSIAKPFVCNLCKKSFWQRSHLEIHERSHTGETPFTCSMCGKGFNSRGKLSIHEMLHAEKKPYKCVTCGSSFSVQAYLKSHMRMHTDDRPYECKLCGKKYRKKINLQFHLNRTHDCNENS